MGQNADILRVLKSGRSITPREAYSRFDCMRLGARIYDLRCKGHDIITERIERKGKKYARYWLNNKRVKK
jgi:hypothetical protein